MSLSGDKCGIVSAENGNVSCVQNSDSQESCHLTCNPGHVLSGQVLNQLKCSKSRGWDGESPYCAPVSCGQFPVTKPFPVAVVCSGTKFGDYCSIVCPLGYMLSGESVSKCQANGAWTNVNVSCVPVKCQPLVRFY